MELTEYHESRAVDQKNVQDKFSDAIDALKEFDNNFADGDSIPDRIIENFVTELIDKGLPIKFHQYYYDDVYYRCGDRAGGETTYLLCVLNETQVKNLMREFYFKSPKDFCRHKFLRSLSQYGIIIDESATIYGDLLSYNSVDLGKITEEDICSPEEYSKIIAERKRLEEERAAKAKAEFEAKEKQKRKEMYEKLKLEFGKLQQEFE